MFLFSIRLYTCYFFAVGSYMDTVDDWVDDEIIESDSLYVVRYYQCFYLELSVALNHTCYKMIDLPLMGFHNWDKIS